MSTVCPLTSKLPVGPVTVRLPLALITPAAATGPLRIRLGRFPRICAAVAIVTALVPTIEPSAKTLPAAWKLMPFRSSVAPLFTVSDLAEPLAVSCGLLGVPAGITTSSAVVGTCAGFQFDAVDQLVLVTPVHVITGAPIDAVAWKVMGFPVTPEAPTVASSVFGPWPGPMNQPPTVAIPAASVRVDPPDTPPPPLVTVKSTRTPGSGLLCPSSTSTEGGIATGLSGPAV